MKVERTVGRVNDEMLSINAIPPRYIRALFFFVWPKVSLGIYGIGVVMQPAHVGEYLHSTEIIVAVDKQQCELWPLGKKYEQDNRKRKSRIQ